MKPLDSAGLESCLAFIREIDTLKTVERKTKPMSIDRRENSAEHSWHLAVMAMVLAGAANSRIDLTKVLKMLLLHDLPEIHTGDILVYDRPDNFDELEREAAQRLFGMLPENLRKEFQDLWEEFEAGQTEEAKFARALDRFQPCFCNYHNGGGTWREFGISREAMLKLNRPVEKGSEALWQYLVNLSEMAEEKGFFPAEKDVNYG